MAEIVRKPPTKVQRIQKTLDEKALELFERYKNDPVNDTVNVLNMGHEGTGKTESLLTAPRPLLIDSFDPKGTVSPKFKAGIAEGSILVDRYEHDSWKNPETYRRWEQEYNEKYASGIFEHLGTYSIDSLTGLSKILMYFILKDGGRPGTTPQIQDYGRNMWIILDLFDKLMSLPCNVIVNGHIALVKDEVEGKVMRGLLIAGQLSDRLPPAFSEKWISKIRQTAQGKTFFFQVHGDGRYRAETRIGSGIFEDEEPQDYRALLKKAGYPFEDKPSLIKGNSMVTT